MKKRQERNTITVTELTDDMKHLEVSTNLQLRIETLEASLKAKDKTIEELKTQLNDFHLRINHDVSWKILIQKFSLFFIQVFFQKVPPLDSCRNVTKLSKLQDLEEKLDAKTRAHEKACKTIQLLLMKTRDLDAEISEVNL